MRQRGQSFRSDESGAVAATYAVALMGLIMIAGVGFDYARLATMDSELQNGADQAALAGATQLDGETGACSRAATAALELVSNITILSNDGEGNAITIQNEPACDQTGWVRFYQDEDRTPATSDSDAHFIELWVDARVARYALTPIMGAVSSDQISAAAMAGLGSSICNTPPVMMCNPSEPVGNGDRDYPFTASEGDGLRLIISSPQTPGDFGFLQTGYGTGAQALAKALGYNSVPADCSPSDGVDTEPGDKEAVRAAFNTRFDMSESGQNCPGGGTCSPSRNARKDLVRGNNCSSSGNQGWQEAPNPYRAPSPTTPLASDGSQDPDMMGYPRDMCHAVSVSGACSGGIVGDSVWDRNAYFRVNYGWDSSTWMSNTGLSADATRYDVYKWELDNPTQADMVQNVGGNKNAYSYPVCRAPGITPNETTADRRRMTVAVINCEAENVAGREYGVRVLKWMDVFLVEPAYARGSGPSARTTNGDVYVEVIEEPRAAGGGDVAAQTIRRDVPYLVR